MFIYGMLTQHRHGVETVQTMANLALMRGNIGRPGPARRRLLAATR